MKKILRIFLSSLTIALLSVTAYASSLPTIIDDSDLLTSDDEAYFQYLIEEIFEQYDCLITIVVEEFDTADEMHSYVSDFDNYNKHQSGIVYMNFGVGEDFDFQFFGRGKYQDIDGGIIGQLMANIDNVKIASYSGEEYFDILDGAISIIEDHIKDIYTPPSPPPEEYMGIGGMINGFDPMIDAAEVMSEAEEELLFDKIEYIYQNYDFDVTFMTMAKVPDDQYLLYYFDWYTGLDPERDGVIFGIDLDPDNRDYATSTRNLGIYAFTEDALDLIDYNVVPLLTEGRYFEAFDLYLDYTIHFLDCYNAGTPYEIPLDKESFWILVIAVPLVFSLAIGSKIMKKVFIARMNTAVTQVGADHFRVKGSLVVTHSSDVFTHKSVTKSKIKTSSSSSGGGSTRSGYGGSRGGRSGKF